MTAREWAQIGTIVMCLVAAAANAWQIYKGRKQ